MSERATSLLAEVLTLSDEERAEIVDGLLDAEDGLSSDAGEITEAEFTAELDRRAEDYRRDPSAAVPWEHVQHMR